MEIGKDLSTGWKALEEGNLEAATVMFRPVFNAEPANVDAMRGLVRTFGILNMDDEAREAVEHHAETLDGAARLLWNARLYEWKNQDAENYFENAKANYEKVLEADPECAVAKSAIARLDYKKNGQPMEMPDGTFIGQSYMTHRPGFFKRRLNLLCRLDRMNREFLKHANLPEPSAFTRVLLKLGWWTPAIIIVLFLFADAAFKMQSALSLVGVIIALGFSLYLKFYLKRITYRLRKHIKSETGTQLCDPDMGKEALVHEAEKTSVGNFMAQWMLTGAVTGGRYYSGEWVKSKQTTHQGRIDINQSPLFMKTKRLSWVMEDAFERHWHFHARNPHNGAAWENGKWVGDPDDFRHIFEGIHASRYDYRDDFKEMANGIVVMPVKEGRIIPSAVRTWS